MKKALFVVIMSVFSVSLSAQISLGLRGGLNFTKLPSETFTVGPAQITTLPDSYTGFHIGLMGQIKLPGFFIQPELLYLATGNEFKYESETAENDIFFTQRFHRIDVPVLLGWRTGPLRVGAGPVASAVINSSSNLTESDMYTDNPDFRERYNSATWGYQLGVGLDLGNIALDLKYEGSLSRFNDGITIGESRYEFDTRPRQIIFSIGLMLF